MRSFSLLRIAVLGAATALLSVGVQAGPMPTNVAAMKSMVDKNTTEVRWGGRVGGFGYRGVGRGYGGGLGYRGWGGRGLGYGVAAGAIVGGAIARSAYYGGYDGGDYGYPSYSYAAEPPYGYGGSYGYSGGYRYHGAYYGGLYGGGCGCPSYGGYVTSGYYAW